MELGGLYCFIYYSLCDGLQERFGILAKEPHFVQDVGFVTDGESVLRGRDPRAKLQNDFQVSVWAVNEVRDRLVAHLLAAKACELPCIQPYICDTRDLAIVVWHLHSLLSIVQDLAKPS